jgi:hypothetical protein
VIGGGRAGPRHEGPVTQGLRHRAPASQL